MTGGSGHRLRVVRPIRHRVALLLVATVLGGCTWESSEADPVRSDATSLPTVPAARLPRPSLPTTTVEAITTTAPAGAAACVEVTYTPPTATDARTGLACEPSAPSRPAGVVLVHGGGGTTGDRTAMGAWQTAYLTAGYPTLAIDYTLFSPGIESPVFPRPETDVKAAVQWMRIVGPELGASDDAVIVHGLSAGARLGAVAHTSPNDPWFEGDGLWIDVSDRVDALVGFYSTYDGSLGESDRQYYGGRRDDVDHEIRRAWQQADSVVNGPDASGPAFFVTGSLDWDEIVVQQEALAAGVRAAGHDAETVVVDGADHGFDSTPGRFTDLGQLAADAVFEWLDTHFPAA